MGTEKSFRLFRRWDKPANEQGDQNNGADNGINGGMSRQARSSGDQKTLDCTPGSSMADACVGTRCKVSCGGKEVEMECPEGGVNIDGSTVTCGKAKKVTFAPCFPFC